MESDEPIVRARDLMQRDVITVSPDTPILDVHRLFVEEEIHGAPVVGDDGIVYGVVSALDLLRVVRDELEPGAGATMSTTSAATCRTPDPTGSARPKTCKIACSTSPPGT